MSDFLVFGEDYNRHPHALEHILRPQFENHRFLWVETIGLRSPTLSLYDLKRVIDKLAKWFSPKSKQTKHDPFLNKNVFIVRPLMIPYNQFKFIRWLNKLSVKFFVQKKINELHFKNIISISSVPNAADYIGEFSEIKKIYFCVDEFSLWPGLDYKLVKNLEDLLLSKVDQLIATSDALAESKKGPKLASNVITHGVVTEHFQIPDKSFDRNNICIAYFGLIDQRSDQDILSSIAKNFPEIKIKMIGPIATDISKLQKFNNIVFTGKIDYHDLPKNLIDVDILILPYVQNELTRNLNPLKLKEYIVTKRFVISTPIAEVKKFNHALFLADNAEEFVELIRKIKNQTIQPIEKSIINQIATNESWKNKSEILMNLIFK